MIMNTLFPFLSLRQAQTVDVCSYSWTFCIAIDVKTSHQRCRRETKTNMTKWERTTDVNLEEHIFARKNRAI